MSWDSLSKSEVSLEPSGSETARFGHTVERLTVGFEWQREYTRVQLGRRLRELLASSVARTIILRYPTAAVFVPGELGEHGRTLYPAGSLLYWERLEPFPSDPGELTELRSPAIPETVMSQFRAVIADSFGGYINHYSANPLIGEDVIPDGYLEWAESTILDQHNRVVFISVDGRVAGVAVIECLEGSLCWEVQLAGMSSGAQGKGYYTQLVTGVLATARKVGVPRVVISTQAHNVRVQRAWARLGFVPFASIDTVHLVRVAEES
ncbi:MAG: GNAT family N-acetyltransferase [Demequinaceae bacterium]|nr:GNAT family N-acetyltransferase [Demequinaceae bacterium]